MGFKVILTPQSLDDLQDIVTFIAKDNLQRARTFGNELIDRALSAALFPERGRTVPEIGDPTVREIIHGAYRIVYEIFQDQQTVYVLRFWHGARGKPRSNPSEQQRGRHDGQSPESYGRFLMSQASRKPSPTKFRASSVVTRMPPGKIISHQ